MTFMKAAACRSGSHVEQSVDWWSKPCSFLISSRFGRAELRAVGSSSSVVAGATALMPLLLDYHFSSVIDVADSEGAESISVCRALTPFRGLPVASNVRSRQNLPRLLEGPVTRGGSMEPNAPSEDAPSECSAAKLWSGLSLCRQR